MLQILDLYIGLFSDVFEKFCYIIFLKWGGGSKAVWDFSKKSSNLIAPPFPKDKKIEVVYMADFPAVLFFGTQQAVATAYRGV